MSDASPNIHKLPVEPVRRLAEVGAERQAASDLRETLRALWRRRLLMLATLVAGMVLVGLVLSGITPRYSATAKVMVDPRQANVVDLQQVMAGLPVNAETVQSEIEVITSADLAARVVERAGLVRVPEFNPTLQETRGVWRWLSGRTEKLDEAGVQRAVVNAYQESLRVRAVGRSRVIDISFTSADPALAASVANATADLYLTSQLQAKFDATLRASRWLNDRLSQLRAEAEAAELAVARFKTENRAGARKDDAGEAEVRLRTLERQAEANRNIYEVFLARAKETGEQMGLVENGLLQADARLISKAEVPEDPSFPNTRLFLLLALAGSAGLALILAFLAEQLDSGFRSSDQIEQELGLTTLALLPSLDSLGVRDQTPERFLATKPTSAFAEAMRILRTSLLLANVDNPPKVLMVTSALPGEGKTTTVLALARLAAMAGERVLVIDADIRRPRVHEVLKIENREGLVELLSGRASLEEVLRSSDPDGKGIHLLTSGQQNLQATELVRSQQMRALIQRLRALYSLILIDSPPVLPVADAKMLSSLSDRVLFVVKWNDVRREVVAHAVKQLREVGAHFVGAVLNNVNVRRHAEYGYGDSGYYYGKKRNYYSN